VRENPMKEENTPENPIRRFMISPQIFALVKGALMDPDLENLPTDYDNGLDFTVVKTSKGGYADYSTSKWARKETPLTVDEMEAVEKFGLFNLAEFLPKRPSAEDLVIMKEMFEASVDGQAYDPAKWGHHFKPAGFRTDDDATHADGNTAAASKPEAKAAPAPAAKPAVKSAPAAHDPEDFDADEHAAPVVSKPAATGSRAEDILALIRSRQKSAV